MLEHKQIQGLDDYFRELNSRREKGVYFYRINGYTEEIGDFIKKYYEVARRNGVIIEGKIQNPTEKNLAYYDEIMGMNFQMNLGFMIASLKKWLPRMNDFQRQNVAEAIYDNLDSMRKNGKTENMLKNAYIKFMCWLYYKFERIVNQLGENSIPKILYEGEISHYELMLVSILSNAGCDVILLQYRGDQEYLKVDAGSKLSVALTLPGMKAFPAGYSMKSLREEMQNAVMNERLYGTKPSINNCTNAWIKGKGFDDIRQSTTVRGTDPKFFYNCFLRINGAEDRMTYENELFQFQQELRNSKRRVVIVNGEIPKPTSEEIAGIKRGNYARQDQMILDLASNIQYGSNPELQRIVNKAFVDIILDEAKTEPNLNKLTNKAVYMICWLKRYMQLLFSSWKMPDIACFIHMGGCKTGNEAMFLRILARMPVDVCILCPNLNTKGCLEDKLLFEITYTESIALDCFPEDRSQVRIGTVAYHAERDLDTLMYENSGIYRNQQYGKANVITLQTMYEEIKLLWNQEMKYRPNFSTADGEVNVPVIFSKISGVKDGDVSKYWVSIKELVTEDTIVITNAPYLTANPLNPMKPHAPEFYKNGKLQKQKIKDHPQYGYGILREDMQDFMLDRLEAMIDQRLIKGIGENGAEYSVIAEVLNLPKDVIRMIQKFDFTKKNPKLVYINTSETVISFEDTVLVAFLNLIGFDIVFFVPTGYQCVEKHFNKILMEEHQIGEYKYDLQVPDLNSISLTGARSSWRDKIFKRGK